MILSSGDADMYDNAIAQNCQILVKNVAYTH